MAHRHFEEEHHAQLYAKHRPRYPEELFATLAEFASKKASLQCAVDVGCGSGQATFGLARHFAEVIGADPSEAQVACGISANNYPNVKFIVSSAEHLPLQDNSVDLISAAQAIHWMNFDQFYKECDRVLRPGGVIAAYGYGVVSILHPVHAKALTDVVHSFYRQTVNDRYWDDRLVYLDNEYTAPEMQIPYEDKLRNDAMAINVTASVREFILYLSTWSGYRAKLKAEPKTQCLQEISASLLEILGEKSDETKLDLTYPIYLLMGRKPTA